MEAYLDCYPCFFRQALKTMRLITQDEKKILEVLNQISLTLPKLSFEATPTEIGKEVYKIISEKTGIVDPYKAIKESYIRQALSFYPHLKRIINSSPDRLMTAIRLAIAGNVIDYGANAGFNLEEDIQKILIQDLAINHYQQFINTLEKAEKILYLADNAGETVFDRLLIEELPRPVIYAVRAKPIINDATRKDAFHSGLDKVTEIVSSGCDAPGIVLNLCSREFLEIYRSAGLIISKGQGNYEGLSGEKGPIFFLLKAKCSVIARDIGLKRGSIILMKANN